jgi:membrane fusion protein, multidrug efflux system
MLDDHGDSGLAETPLGATGSGAPSAERPAGTKKASRRLRRALPYLAAALIVTGGGFYGDYWWRIGRFLVTTDDAYVGAKSSTISPKVSGYIQEVAVDDNAAVKAGDLLVRIDDGDYRLAVAMVADQIAVQRATIERLGKQIIAQLAAVDQAKAQRASADAGAIRAELELKRQQDLAAREINSRQSLEQAQANRDQAIASVQSAEAQIQSAAANVDVLKAQQEEARGSLKQLQTQLAKAERDLSFTIIRAPFDGVVGNRAVQVGDYVQPMQRLASLVPLDAVYIDANFKETQLARLRPGQPVSITVDAIPDRKIEGRVASLAPASGSVFSLLPPDNATGNFTKVVQRLPVRILVPVAIADQAVLRPGMSVVVSVNTKPGAPVAAQAMSAKALRASAN